MQLHSQQFDLEAGLAELIAAQFPRGAPVVLSTEEEQIARLKALIARTPPRSHMRIIYEHRMRDIPHPADSAGVRV